MIEAKHIHKSFNSKEVLRDINAKFNPGRINFIIGASGSGKSVFMKCLIGLLKPNQGEIFYNGDDFLQMTEYQKKRLYQQIGVLFQASALFDSFTTQENVAFPLRFFTDKSKAEVQERVDFCLERVGLTGAHQLLPSELSGGMKKRVGIARAIALNPKYLFCDEPNSGLDPQNAILIDNLIRELTVEFNTTTVINSHDMNSVFEIGDYMIYLHKGDKWWEGHPNNIRDSGNEELYKFVYASKYLRETYDGDKKRQ